jgi:TonB-dependent receptor
MATLQRPLCAAIRLLLLSACPLAAHAAEPAPDPAADAPPRDEAKTLDAVQVAGYRAAATAAVDAKRDSNVVIDAVSDDDIGSLPDLSIVESARRIVGLSTVAGMDTSRNRDLYERVTIRGLDPKYNLITIDGVPLASSETDVRGARLDQLPSPMVSSIQAVKTLTAEYDPHGLGGQVNLFTRSAFDNPDGFIVVNGALGHASSAGGFVEDDKPSQKANMTASRVFGDRGQLGVVVSADWQKLWSTSHSQLPGDDASGWTYYTASGGTTPFADQSRDGILVPVRPQEYRFQDERTRKGVNGKVEYQFEDGGELSLFAGHYEDTDEELRSEQLALPGGAPTAVTADGGSVASGRFQQGIVYQPQERKTSIATLKGAFQPAERVHLDFTASWSKATSDLTRDMYKWASDITPGTKTNTNAADYGYGYTIDGGKVVLDYPSTARALDPDSYDLYYLRNIDRRSESTVGYLAGNLSLNAQADDEGLGARFGWAHTRTRLTNDQTYREWYAKDAASQAAIGGLTDYIYGGRWSSTVMSGIPYFVVDPAKAAALIANHPEWLAEADRTADDYSGDFKDVETVTGAYAEAVFRSERLYAVAGFRYDSTDVGVTTWSVQDPSQPSLYSPDKRQGGYTHMLPSALVTWRLNDDSRLTAAVSKTIGRPDYGQYAATTSYSVTSADTLAISRGNPDLKPRQSLNLDLSWEWYLPDGGLVSAAAFQKKIRNEIFTAVRAGEPTTYNGVLYQDVTESTPMNSARGKVRGLELNYVTGALEFLPPALKGLGLSANLTLLDGEFDIPASDAAIADGAAATRRSSGLIQQPDYIANATVFYLRGPFEARVSWNRIGRALQVASSDTAERDLYAEPRQQLDLQLRYAVNPAWDVMFQAQNLTREPFVIKQGPGRAYVNNYFPVGSTLWLGFSWHPKG